MKKSQFNTLISEYSRLIKLHLIIKLGIFLLLTTSIQSFGVEKYSQFKLFDLSLKKANIVGVFTQIENQGVNYPVMDNQIVFSSFKSNEAGLPEQPRTREISGTVRDSEGLPLVGVTIVIKGTTIGTITDINGAFRIEVPLSAETIVSSYVGMKAQEINIIDQTVINVIMEKQTIGIEEVIMVGYGSQKKVNITGAVATVSSADLEKMSTVNSSELLQGQLLGVITKQSSGMPGDDNISFSIRGYGEPLILVDGEERSLSSVDPDMIESISVLKDASAAIYGSKSGNGVILITTKRGKLKEDLKITYNGSYSLQQFTHKPKVITDAGIYTEFLREAELNSNLTPTFSEEEIQKYYNREPLYESYDWWSFTFRNLTGRQKHNLSLQGGGENIAFYASIGATDQQSVITSDSYWYKRYNIQSNIDGNISDNLSFALNFNYIHEHRSFASNGIWRDIYKTQPMAPTSFPGSDLIPASNLHGTHPLLIGSMNKDIEGGTDDIPETFNGNFELAYNFPFVQGLSSKASLDYFVINTRTRQIQKKWDYYLRNPETGEIVWNGMHSSGNIINNMASLQHNKFSRLKPKLELRYDRVFGDHEVNGLVLGEYFDQVSDWYSASTQNLLSNELLYLNFGDRTYHDVNQEVIEATRASFAGRLNYAYDGKYLLEGTFRYDASSIFPPDTRWGFFPSISAGWRISEETFMENVSWLDNMKLRASYGRVGYDLNAIRYDYFAGYDIYTSPPYIIGSNAYRRIQMGTLPNYGMTWEKMTTYNVGLDANMWHGLLNIVFEGFYRKRTDILAVPQRSLPSTLGASFSQQNLNSLDDRGVELELSHNNRIGDLSYRIKGIVTYARSKWLHYEEEEFISEDDIRILQNSGKWRNRSIGYVSDGLFRSQEEIENHPINQDQTGNTTLVPGDIKYKDLNGDGLITWADQKEIGFGTGNPDLNFGFNLGGTYKGLSLDILLHGGSMFSGYVSGLAQTPFDNFSTPMYYHWDERFHVEKNPDGILPSVSISTRSNNIIYSDFWLKNITFLRLKNINLSYSLPKQWFAQSGIQGIRAYITMNNLAVISNLGIYASEFDPESFLSNTGYPPHRTFTFGLNLTL